MCLDVELERVGLSLIAERMLTEVDGRAVREGLHLESGGVGSHDLGGRRLEPGRVVSGGERELLRGWRGGVDRAARSAGQADLHLEVRRQGAVQAGCRWRRAERT